MQWKYLNPNKKNTILCELKKDQTNIFASELGDTTLYSSPGQYSKVGQADH